MTARRPTRAELEAALDRRVPDVLAPDLSVLFCGINPGRYSGATGRHFAGPGNRFWALLWRAGFTDRVLRPEESDELLTLGVGITNLVPRVTATAAQVTADELRDGARQLEDKVATFAPAVVAFLGIQAYRIAFGRHATPGLQPARLSRAALWLLANPSGLQASYSLEAMTTEFDALRRYACRDRAGDAEVPAASTQALRGAMLTPVKLERPTLPAHGGR